MAGWEPIRHQVAISGRVTDDDSGAAVPGAIVTIIDMPDEFKTKSDSRLLQAVRPGRRETTRLDEAKAAPDGHYYFLDLPKGQYVLKATGPGRNPTTGTRKAKVSADDQGNLVMATVDISVKRGKERSG